MECYQNPDIFNQKIAISKHFCDSKAYIFTVQRKNTKCTTHWRNLSPSKITLKNPTKKKNPQNPEKSQNSVSLVIMEGALRCSKCSSAMACLTLQLIMQLATCTEWLKSVYMHFLDGYGTQRPCFIFQKYYNCTQHIFSLSDQSIESEQWAGTWQIFPLMRNTAAATEDSSLR